MDNKKIVEIYCGNYEDALNSYHEEAVFHRAYDCVNDPYKAIELGIDRVLTSGLEPKAMEGIELIKELQEKYGDRI
ncbi:MAG: copper homeostasis protein CutC [Erysipelotrichales bacterium]|nr:copper homeostasis protein CutC [Erysipelotrichales bacterium]